MKLFLVGCIIGIGKVLPGISGSILAIRLGIYEKVVTSIVCFFDRPKENMQFLSILGGGFVFSTILGSKILLQLFIKYNLILKVIFLLFILTGIPDLIKKGKSWRVTFLAFLITSSLFLIPTYQCKSMNLLDYFLMGGIEAFSTIVPGISGTAIYLSLGWYETILAFFSELYLFPFTQIIPFLMGLALFGFLLLKWMGYLLKNYPRYTYSAILGFLLSSLFFVF